MTGNTKCEGVCWCYMRPNREVEHLFIALFFSGFSWRGQQQEHQFRWVSLGPALVKSGSSSAFHLIGCLLSCVQGRHQILDPGELWVGADGALFLMRSFLLHQKPAHNTRSFPSTATASEGKQISKVLLATRSPLCERSLFFRRSVPNDYIGTVSGKTQTLAGSLNAKLRSLTQLL